MQHGRVDAVSSRQDSPSISMLFSAATALGTLPSRLIQPFIRLRTERPYLTIGFAVFLIINLIIISAYLWSRGGQTIHVRVEARGDHFAAYVDGKLKAEGEFDAPSQGGLVLTIEQTDRLPSLPEPRGIDSVRVTDLDTGELLFEDDFSSGFHRAWVSNRPAAFSSKDGVLGVRGLGILDLSDEPWRDYAVDVRYKNIASGAIILRAQNPSTGVRYGFRPFREFDNNLALFDEGRAVSSIPGRRIELSKTETVKSLVAMTLKPYPLALALLVLGFVVVAGLQFTGQFRGSSTLFDNFTSLPWLIAGTIASVAFGVTLYLNYSFGSHMPHVPDAVSYIFQAKLLASGRLAAPPPPVADVFDFFSPPFIILSDDKWASVYPFGHPLMLAIGARLGAIWLIPPLVGAASVILVFAIGRKVFHTSVGLLAALLLATSPFFLMTASNFMAHNTAAFYILASLLFLAFIDKRPILYGVLAGLFFGLVFNTRPLSAAALMLPFGIYLLSLVLPQGRRLVGVKQISGFMLGGLVMLGAYWFYNLGTTGDAFTSGYQAATVASGGLGESFGFDGRHSVNIGIQNEATQMTFLLLVLNGWPQYIGLTFVLLPFILGTRHRWDWFLLGSAVFLMGAYTLWRGSAIMHGPRYWYEAAPLLMLLAARGADRAAELLTSGADWIRGVTFDTDRQPPWAGLLVVYTLVAALMTGSMNGWLLGNQTQWEALFVPNQATSLRGFNFIDDRLTTLVDEVDLDNALVLVEVCPNWWCYGNVFWMNSPTLDGDVVFARDIKARRGELFEAYPDRKVYLATYTNAALVPFGSTSSPPGTEEPPTAPIARDIVLPTPTPTPSPIPTPTPTPTPSSTPTSPMHTPVPP